MNWVAACSLWKQPLSTQRYGNAYMLTFASRHCTNIQYDLLQPLAFHHTHFTHSVILTCTHSLVSFGQSTVEERVHCRQRLRCWNKAKVQGCNTSHEHRDPPPTELGLEVGLPVKTLTENVEEARKWAGDGSAKGAEDHACILQLLQGSGLGMG